MELSANQINFLVTAGGTLLTAGGTLFGYLQWTEARNTKKENQRLNEQIEKIATNTNFLPLIHKVFKKIEHFQERYPEDNSLNEQVALIKQEIQNFEESIKYNQEAAGWLANKNVRLHLAKDAGDEALRICSLKLLDTERNKFYKDILKYLTWIFFTLNFGVPISTELISPSLQKKEAYREAFKYILKMIPKHLSVDADERVRTLIDNLISSFG